MLIIEKTDQKMDLENYKKRKKKNPYKNMRTNAKYVNFGMIFGQVASAFGLGTLKDNWDESDCDNFIRDNSLSDLVEDILERDSKRGITKSHLDAKYVACATVIRDVWFKLYPGIEKWIFRSVADGVRDGFIRSPFGARRLVPELTYCNGEDENQRHIKNLKNITANSPVQNHEVVFMNRAQKIIVDYIKEHGLNTRMIGNIHDAAVKYLHNDEQKILLPIIHQAFSMNYPENNGIPIEGETNIADPRKNEYWGFGNVEIGKEEALKGDYEDIGTRSISVKEIDYDDDLSEEFNYDEYEGDY